MRVLFAAVLAAIICITSIAFAIDSIRQRLYHVSTAILGGDRLVTANMPFAASVYKSLQDNNLHYTESIHFYSMLSNARELVLSSVKAVDQKYPLIGNLKTSQEITSSGTIAASVPEQGTIWIEPRALLQLDAKIGDIIKVSDADLKLTAILTAEPDRLADGFTFAPRALMNIDDVASTKAVIPGSRVTYKLQITGATAALNAFDAEMAKLNHGQYEIKTVASEMNALKNVDIAEKYLSLALLVNLVLAGVTVAIAARQYSQTHTKDAAVLRCFGASKLQLVLLYTSNLCIAAIIIGLLGSGIGYGIQVIIAHALEKFLRIGLPDPRLWPFVLGCACSLILILGIGLPAILRLIKIPPFQLLHASVAVDNYNSWRLHFNFGTKIPALLRLSLNNITYNSQNNLIQVLAFALVICVALILFAIRSDLLNSWQAQIPKSAPNYFVLNIPEDVVDDFKDYLATNNVNIDPFYPVFRGTLIKINNEEVSMDDTPGKRTGIHRPLNLTWSKDLPVENQVLQGVWFKADDYGKPLISIEREIAQRLNVTIGDKLTFNITDEEVTAEITNIRSVVWGSFTPNFYVIYNEGFIKNQPLTYMGSFYLADSQAHILLPMIKNFPQTNLINVAAMVDQAQSIISLLSLVVVFIWLFTLIVGFLLLLSVVMSTLRERIYQNNLMRILGANKRQLQYLLIIEYCILGSVAGAIGASVALFSAQYVSEHYFSLVYNFNWLILLYGMASGILIMLAGGMYGTSKALNSAPLQITREN